jgi:hypothetical protein
MSQRSLTCPIEDQVWLFSFRYDLTVNIHTAVHAFIQVQDIWLFLFPALLVEVFGGFL